MAISAVSSFVRSVYCCLRIPSQLFGLQFNGTGTGDVHSITQQVHNVHSYTISLYNSSCVLESVKYKTFYFMSFYLPRILTYKCWRSSFTCCLPPSSVMLRKKLQLHFGFYLEFGKKSAYQVLPGVYVCFYSHVL